MFDVTLGGPMTAATIDLVIGLRLLLWPPAGEAERGPARILGGLVVAIGASIFLAYAVYWVPGAPESMLALCVFVSRILAAFASLLLLLFVRRVFRPDARLWAGAALVSGGALAVGILVPGLSGDLFGYMPLTNPWFWFEEVGLVIPFAWAAVLATSAVRLARRRVALGLTRPIVTHRLGCWSIFLITQTAGLMALIGTAILLEIRNGLPFAWSLATGSLDVISAIVLLLGFQPLSFQRRRFDADATTAEGH